MKIHHNVKLTDMLYATKSLKEIREMIESEYRQNNI